MEKMTIQNVQNVVSVLNEQQQQLLKDTIRYGCWGDSSYEFWDENDQVETVGMMGYCSNDAKEAGHFSGRQVSGMFRGIYSKLCPNNGIGKVISHHSDWWGDGSGDMLFIRSNWVDAFEEWARQ